MNLGILFLLCLFIQDFNICALPLLPRIRRSSGKVQIYGAYVPLHIAKYHRWTWVMPFNIWNNIQQSYEFQNSTRNPIERDFVYISHMGYWGLAIYIYTLNTAGVLWPYLPSHLYTFFFFFVMQVWGRLGCGFSNREGLECYILQWRYN